MGFFNKLVNDVRSKLSENNAHNKADKEIIHRIRLEADIERKEVFEKEMRKNTLRVARIEARKEAEKASGIQKLFAENRLINLNKVHKNAQDTLYSKLSNYTRANLARRNENMERTARLRMVATKMKEERKKNNNYIKSEGVGKIWKM